MEVIPAIDLKDGRCVRLQQGDYARETIFDGEPASMARRWVSEGAMRIHVVDLDGARDGFRKNAAAVRTIVQAVTVPVQLGGGIRDAAGAQELIDLGVDRVIFGTAAVEAPEQVELAVRQLGSERVMVSVDARNGRVATRGWTSQSDIQAEDLMNRMSAHGVSRFMYTDISRDGTLSHPNFEAVSEIVRNVRYPIVVAGGIATIDDLLRLSQIGAEAAVTGIAVYSGALDLKRAIKEISAAAHRVKRSGRQG